MRDLLAQLNRDKRLDKASWARLIAGRTPALAEEAFALARRIRQETYGNRVFIRGLIEISNICQNNCYYCGIRRGNTHASRYRLDRDQILACAAMGYRLGFRTFVLQGGEDPQLDDAWVVAIIRALKKAHPDCAVTLSMGEKSRVSYERFFEAGADRYLLRHETGDPAHYRALHPTPLTLENRLRCLYDLKAIGYQTGSGFMVGSPGQTPETLAEDFMILQALCPEMVGIGPFIPHHETPFKDYSAGSVELTLYCIALIRILLPYTLIPATTALNTLDPEGRTKGMLAGANVVMPNLSPPSVRGKYLLYDKKLATGEESAEAIEALQTSMRHIGYDVVVDRGDYRRPDAPGPV